MEVWVEAAGAGAGAPLALALPAGACAEEAVRAACKRLRLAPAARPLLALRPRAERCFLPDAAPVQPRRHYQLRVRYKVPKLRHLKSLDDKAYDFYFQQARNDVIENNIPEIQYPLHKKELLGLGITDMYRAILEDNMSLSEVERNYKRYIPKEIVRKHQFFTKKPIHNTLQQICANPKAGHDVNYIKGQYLQQLMMMAPNYLSEEYSCRYDMGSNEWAPGKIQVIPFHQHEPGLRIFNELKKTWVHICTIEQLCFLGRKASDHEVEVCRKNGIPMYFKFNSASEISSFISCCDGYYRLMVKWTFNLSKDDPTPSLQRLYRMKCHGPVGGEFSYHKLEEKRAKKHGCFILRECQHDYDVYYIDVCTKNNTTETYKVEYEGHCYIFNSDKDRPYSSLECLINSFNDSESRIYLEECLPPSEYDKSQLLLCGEHHKVGVRIDQTELQELLKHHKSPRCINTKDILYFKVTGLTIGSKEIILEETPHILKATEYTNFTLSWRENMLVLGKQGVIKPIYLAEMDDLGTLVKLKNATFNYYSFYGTNAIWEFPFCDDEFICEQHTTFAPIFSTSWPLRQNNLNYDLQVFLRTFHTAIVCLTMNPYHEYPRIIIYIGSPDNKTKVMYQPSENFSSILLEEVNYPDIVGYFEWAEIHVTMFAQEMHIMRKVDSNLETVLRARHEIMNSMRWYSLGSNFSVAHWTMYCQPGEIVPAYPPECVLSVSDISYVGSQATTREGNPCVPWIDNYIIPVELHTDSLYITGRTESLNYCRNVLKKPTGPWCYALTPTGANEQVCHVRRCNAMDCKVAGTANDYVGQLATTRSNRTCQHWSTVSTRSMPSSLRNKTLFPESSVSNAANYCRNPSRSLAGAWCYTTDKNLTKDLCDVRDCALEETNIVLTKKGGALRYIYMLPEWKYTGLNGGLHFSLKEWNPDFLDGIMFKVFSVDKAKSYTLYIGAENNEKVILRFKDDSSSTDKVLLQKALPHLIPAGKWARFWIQLPKGQVKLGYQKREYPIFEWEATNDYETFEPSFLSYQSLEGNVIGIHFQDKQCHTENTSTLQHTRVFSLRMWKSEQIKDYSNISIYLRGNGIALIPLLVFPGTQVLGSEGITATYKAIWKLDETKKIEVALKTLVREKIDSHLKDFIELANKWACVQSSAVVRLYGVTLMSPSSLVMEYLQYGPLDVYLSENGDSVEPIHLIKAAAALARALWDLTEAGCVHGRIRCSKVLLAQHDHEKFIVKLSDPGLHNYTEDDCHWIPVEYFSDMNLARKCVSADVWAFGTTLWEMFSYGLSPTQTNPVLRAKSYEIGHRLSCPQQCPRDVWEVIRECWLPDPHRRAIPQVIMRDISHLLHREYIPTANPYESIDLPEVSAYVSGAVETVSSEFLFNNQTSDTISDRSQVTVDSSLSLPSTSFITGPEHDMTMESVYPYDSYQSYETDAHHMQWILGLGPDCRVTLHKRIGVGNYGEVCKGILERDDYKESQLVAVKKLKSNGDQGMLNDFRKEIEVMKSLQHANIVEILGVCEEREMLIVMEYIEHGALNSYLKIYKYKLQHTHLLKYALDVACGMDYLSAKHLVHRDLAARNILVVDEHNVKISDFGLARFTTDNDKYQMKTVRDLPLSWYAPESAVQYEFSSQSDVWSYGVTLWEMFTYGLVEVPSFDLKEPHNRAESFVMPEGCPSDVYRRLMSPCWNYLPADRPKFIQLTHICKQLMMQY